MRGYTDWAIVLLISLAGMGWTLVRVVSFSQNEHTRTVAVEREYRKQAMFPYDDVEMTNAGTQLEWIQTEIKGEKVSYKTPPFVRTW